MTKAATRTPNTTRQRATHGQATKPTTTRPHGKPTAKRATKPAELAATEPATAAVLPVRSGEDPWSPDELAEVQLGLSADVARLRTEIAAAEHEIAGLLRDSGEGAGDDQADTGTKNFEREHEMSLANNSRGMLIQSERALARIADGTYGACEHCGNAIGKARLQAFPRATLCVSCKQREERR